MEFIKGCIMKSCIVFNRKFVGLIDFYLIMKKYLKLDLDFKFIKLYLLCLCLILYFLL